MTHYPTASGHAADQPAAAPGGGTAITAGVLACLGGAHRLLSILVLVAGIVLLSDLDADGETDAATTLFAISIPVFLIVGVLLLTGGIQMLRRKASGRGLIVAGCAADIAFSVIELVVVEAVAGAGDYTVLGSPAYVLLTTVFPILTIVFTQVAPTTRWLGAHATPASPSA